MAVYVLVHGAWHGGWCWKKVTPLLSKAGHEVFTPTLTGLGERSHLLNPSVDLKTHIQDIVNVIKYEDLSEVILVGHSYAGMVITGVAEEIPEKISKLVYLDAFVPSNNQSLVDLINPQVVKQVEELVNTIGEGWLFHHFPIAAYGVTEETDVQWLSSKLSPQPYKTQTQALTVCNENALTIARTYIYCHAPAMGHFEGSAQVAKEKGWNYKELATGHDAMVLAPKELTEILLELA